MFQILVRLGLTYVAASGAAAAACVVGRGLCKATRELVRGNFQEAGIEAGGAVIAPAVLAYKATANLIGEVVDGTSELIVSVLGPDADVESQVEVEPVGSSNHARTVCR